MCVAFNKYSDIDILEGIKKQDAKVLKWLYNNYYGIVKDHVTRNSGSEEDVADVLQESIIIIYEKAFGSRLAPNDDYLDDMLQELKTIYDDKARGEKLDTIQDYIWEIRYSIPFAQVDTIFGVNEKLEGMEFNARISGQNMRDWVIYE